MPSFAPAASARLRATARAVTRAVAILAAGAGLGLAVNAVRPDGLGLAGFSAPQSCSVGALAVRPVEVLPAAAAAGLCGDPDVLVADARSAARFAQGHIAGAIHLPCAASGNAAQSGLERLEGKHTVVVYGEDTSDARPVAESLRQRLTVPNVRVVVLEGGFASWDGAGLACSSGPCPECAEPASPSTSHDHGAGRTPGEGAP
jgi:rhodanese-related sulfurtransferase